MNEKERQVLEAQLYSIDRHRAELGLVAGTFPPHDFRREAIEREIASLERTELRSPRASALPERHKLPSRLAGSYAHLSGSRCDLAREMSDSPKRCWARLLKL